MSPISAEWTATREKTFKILPTGAAVVEVAACPQESQREEAGDAEEARMDGRVCQCRAALEPFGPSRA